MGAIVVALFLFVFFVAAEAQAVQRPEENADVRAVCRADDPRVKMKLKENLPPAILGGGASRGAEEFESADPQPWMSEKFPLSDGTDAGSEACWAGLSAEQQRLFRSFSENYNVRTHQHLNEPDVWSLLNESEHATFISITYALEHTTLSDRKKRPEGRLSDFVEVVFDLLGESAKHPDDHGDTQYRVFARLSPNARLALRSSREFGEPGINTFGHKGRPVSYRQQGGIPSIQISTDELGTSADIDIDYRSKNPFKGEGHLHPSNSDVRSKRGGIRNYLRFVKRWPGWIRCHLRRGKKGGNGTTPDNDLGHFAGDWGTAGRGDASGAEASPKYPAADGAAIYGNMAPSGRHAESYCVRVAGSGAFAVLN